MNKIVFKDVSKKFHDNQIFSHTNYCLREGLTFLVGKNGAGKTTFINMAVCLEPVNEGLIELFGHTVTKIDKNTKMKIGLQMQNDAFLQNVKVKEYVKLYKALYFGNEADNRESTVDMNKVREMLEIDKLMDRYAYILSGGEKKKVSLYLTIIGNKKLIILDEPTSGIDVQTKDKIVFVIMYIKECGIDVLVSSHDLEEFYSIADNILMLDLEIIYDGTKTDFERNFGYGYRVCTEKIVADSDLLVGMLFEKRYLYSREKETLEKYFPPEDIKRTTAKDFYQIALLSDKKGRDACEDVFNMA